ncbi:Chloroperoxidase [Mycena rebaudengoi]|nr:Chloroperoxidase [Mycena rebaudengoi]
MRSFTLILLLFPVALASRIARDHPSPTTAEVQDGQTGTLIMIPPQATETGLKKIPDADHPFIAPGRYDQRGPCPAMNTLANHGYIPRNGIASFEEIILGMMEAFNLELNFGIGLVAGNMLTRGNMFINKVSIGGVSPLVPPLPFELDGPETGGLSKHGRLEGDASMTRADAFIGDNVHFQENLYDMDLEVLEQFGDDGPEGRNTVFNLATLIAMKKQNIAMDQAANPKFDFAARRVNAAFGQASFILNVFANGTTNQASRAIINSFFPQPNLPTQLAQLMAAVPVAPGRNNAQGVYVADPAPPPPWNSSFACAAYFDLQGNIPNTIWNTRGIFKQNVELLTGIQFKAASANAGCNQQVLPFGPTGV